MSNDTTTQYKTLWSATLIDILLQALQQNEPDLNVIAILKELKKKKLRASYITDKVRRSISDAAAGRVKKLMLHV